MGEVYNKTPQKNNNRVIETFFGESISINSVENSTFFFFQNKVKSVKRSVHENYNSNSLNQPLSTYVLFCTSNYIKPSYNNKLLLSYMLCGGYSVLSTNESSSSLICIELKGFS